MLFLTVSWKFDLVLVLEYVDFGIDEYLIKTVVQGSFGLAHRI